jgi:alanyl-tRNA synthetase
VTDRLYLLDTWLLDFEAEAVAQRDRGGRPAVVLDRTAFYPGGGGQPGDRGTLGGIRVVDVVEDAGEILHLLEAPPPPGRLAGRVDRARRLDHVQQHHGQHLLSAAFERLVGAATLSFHLGEETCTIDLDTPPERLGPERLREAEAAANELVWRDLAVEARERTPEELALLPLRKDAVKGTRVVVVAETGPGGEVRVLDASPCGGTHPRRTGEVGAVAVLRAQKWGAGTRVEFACGGRVLRLLHAADDRTARGAAALRCAPAELPAAAERLAEEGQARRKEVDRLVEALAAAEAGCRVAAAPGPGPVVARLEPPLAGAVGLRAVAQAVAALGRVALVGGVDGDRAHLCFARPRGPGPDLGAALREAVALLEGKGGGSPDLAQGGGPRAGALADALERARAATS